MCEWSDLTEPAVLSYSFLKSHYLLAYMQSHTAPMGVAPEEILLDSLQAPPPKADDFAGGEVSTDELEAMLSDPNRIDQTFPELERLKAILRKYGSRLFAPRDSKGLDVTPAVLHLKPGSAGRLPRQACRFVSKAVLPHLEFEFERRFRETARHLRALLFHAKLRDKWSLAAPLAFGLANAHTDRMLGVSPARLALGPYAQTFDAMPLRAKPQDVRSLTDFARKLDDIAKICMDASRQHFDAQVNLEEGRRGRVVKSKPTASLQPGDYVLREYDRPVLPKAPTKLHPPFIGPYVVTDVARPDIVTCRDLVTKKEVDLHVDVLREFVVPDHVLPQDLIQYALADHLLEWIVERVVTHRFRDDSGRKTTSTLELNIKWAGYDEPTWERYALVKDAACVDEYVLLHSLPRTKEKEA